MHPYEYIKYTTYCLVITSVFLNFPHPQKLPLSKGLFELSNDYFPESIQWVELSHETSNCHVRMEFIHDKFLSQGTQLILESTQWLSHQSGSSYLDQHLHCASGKIFLNQKQVHIRQIMVKETVVSNLRKVISELLKQNLSSIHSAYAHALFLGVSQQLPRIDRDYFKDFGLLYLLAISGFHVQYLYGNFTRFLYLIPGSPLVKKSLVFLIFSLFIPIAGAGPAVFRAVLSQGFQLLIQWSEVPLKKSSQLLWLACVLLIIEPRWILHLGFQLSFMATWGIQQFTFIKSPWSSLTISLRAILATWGLMGVHFGSLSLMSIFVQIPTAIFITLTMTLSLMIIPLKSISLYCAPASQGLYREYFAHLESLFMILHGIQIKLFELLKPWNNFFFWSDFLSHLTQGFYWILWASHFITIIKMKGKEY